MAKKEFAFWIPLLVLFVAVDISLITTLAVKSKREHDSLIDNPPTYYYVEETLEEVFYTTYVVVIDSENYDYDAYYDVYANGFFYRVRYNLQRNEFFRWHWKYINYIQIKGEEK